MHELDPMGVVTQVGIIMQAAMNLSKPTMAPRFLLFIPFERGGWQEGCSPIAGTMKRRALSKVGQIGTSYM